LPIEQASISYQRPKHAAGVCDMDVPLLTQRGTVSAAELQIVISSSPNAA
jgi:hypothetical protein